MDLGHFFQATRRPGAAPTNSRRYTTPKPRLGNRPQQSTLTLPPEGGRFLPLNPADGPGIAGIIELEVELAPVTDRNPANNAQWDLARRLKNNVDESNFDLANRANWRSRNVLETPRPRTYSYDQKSHSKSHPSEVTQHETWGGGGEWRTFSISPDKRYTARNVPKAITTIPPRHHIDLNASFRLT